MLNQDALAAVKELLDGVSSAIVVLGPQPKYDHVASALALTLGLQEHGIGVVVVSPDELDGQVRSLPNHDLVKQKLGNQYLSVSFPYEAESVDKVSYHISDDNSTFYLVVKPQKGTKPLDADLVSFDYTGADADMIFMFGVHNFETLEHLYSEYEELYQRVPVVSINSFETAIGSYKFDTSGYAAMSQAVAEMMGQLGLPIESDAATHLLAGIDQATECFTTVTTNADTFEMVAWLLRTGARRIKRAESSTPASPPKAGSSNTGGSFNPSQYRSSGSGSPFSDAIARNISAREAEYDDDISLTDAAQKVMDDAAEYAHSQENGQRVSLKEKTVSADRGSVEGNTPPISTVAASKSKKTSKKKQKSKQPGGLDYQPGVEGGAGPRG